MQPEMFQTFQNYDMLPLHELENKAYYILLFIICVPVPCLDMMRHLNLNEALHQITLQIRSKLGSALTLARPAPPTELSAATGMKMQ